MKNYEKPAAFYLGRAYDLQQRQRQTDPIVYDAKDLNTHAVIIGMTGSGKTGLGISLLEEALIDHIPVIAIDPKGDLPNLMLSFPELAPDNFNPWVNEQDAAQRGMTRAQYAAQQAQLWKKGLADWDQGPERIARFKQAADITVYTPGSNAGTPVSVLRNFNPPAPGVLAEADLLRERIQTTVTSLLALLGIEADPITSREHIFMANIFEQVWQQGHGLDLAGLIRAIQTPPFERIGVMDLEFFFPAKDRLTLAMRLNNLLAAPGFETWLEGTPLNIGRLLYSDQGRPRASIFSIAHLSDTERMFFVSILLNEILSWVRTQPGTSSLRAILYMDEIFGYFPPTQNPPSKGPLLTLLKQARAFGLGVVLATQNPVDLDYKGLANTGTWFVGRLQTERDKARLLAGLEGAAAGGGFDRGKMEEILAGLGKRVFLLHNVHEDHPVVFQTRWVLSYLRGPMTREQIKALRPAATDAPQHSRPVVPSAEVGAETPRAVASSPPLGPPDVHAFFLPASGAGQGLTYYPAVLGKMDLHYANARLRVTAHKTVSLVSQMEDSPVPVDWDNAEPVDLDLADIEEVPLPGAAFGDLPAAAKKASSYRKWQKDLLRWTRQHQPVEVYRAPALKATSDPGESEGDFRSRLSLKVREKRDLAVEKLRRRYEKKFTTLRNRLMRAEQAIEREKEQAHSRKLDTAISFGSALLGAFMGRKVVSRTSAYRMGTAMKSAGRMRKEKMDVARAEEVAAEVRSQLEALDIQLQEDIAQIDATCDPVELEVKKVLIKPKSTDIALELFGLAWLPFRQGPGGRLTPDWL
jgi:hypothetical protein